MGPPCYLDDGLGFLFNVRQHLLHAGDVGQLPQLLQHHGRRQLLGDLLALALPFPGELAHHHPHGEALHVGRAGFLQHLQRRAPQESKSRITCILFEILFETEDRLKVRSQEDTPSEKRIKPQS